MTGEELKEFLDFKANQYNNKLFIETDPISVPHAFSLKEDIEIAGFLTALISWGNRKSIINNAFRMMRLMDEAPYDFVVNHKKKDLKALSGFVHRTFCGDDLVFLVTALKKIYVDHKGMESVFTLRATSDSVIAAIQHLRDIIMQIPHNKRAEKHIADPERGSAAKRLHMFLRWMVRRDKAGVDFGIWKTIPPSALSCPLDVHSGRVARKLGLLCRKQNDARAVIELDTSLRLLDNADPVKYDFALFGLGVFEGF